MKVMKKQNGSELLLEVDGSIDSLTAPEFNQIINDSLNGVTSLILDLKKVDYISSAGLRVLLVAFKLMSNQGTIFVRNVNSNVMDVFSMTGFDNILTIE